MTTRSELAATELAFSLKARGSLFWIVTSEEERVEDYIFEAANAAKFNTRTWDVAQGVCEAGQQLREIGGPDPGETLNAINERAKSASADRCVWIMRDLPVWLSGAPGAPVMRALRNLARSLPYANVSTTQAIVILTPSRDVPDELKAHATIIDWPLPDREEIAKVLDTAVVDNLGEKALSEMNGQRDAAIDAAVGLTEDEAKSCFNKSLVQLKRVDPAAVAKEKKRVVTRDGLLEWFDPLPAGLDAVGGLENLKLWLKSRAAAFSIKAREYGLPRPKGAMLVGISGCGKSLTAKAIATAWACPLVRVDLNALKGKFVGQSEANLRKVFSIIEALGFCVVWFDEVEKALQGATSGSSDGGVSSDAMGAVLTWMQERKSDAFVIMTANDISALPPEFMRKGRFDELWWIDLPNAVERIEVLSAALRQHGRKSDPENCPVDCAAVAAACEGFTGSEIAAIVPDAMFSAFSDNAREITTDDLLDAAKTVVPLSKTAEKKIADMREKARGRFRMASRDLAVEQQQQRKVRVIS